MDEIRIEGLELSCIVGVRRRERRKKQLVRLDLTLGLDVSEAGQTGRIALTCDYSRVADEVTELLRFRAYRLIEVATEELAAMLFGVHSMLQQVDIRLEKPGALASRARSASVQIHRKRSHYPRKSLTTDFGSLDVLLETHEAGLYLLQVDPGRELPEAADALVRSRARAPESARPASERKLAFIVNGMLERGGRSVRASELFPARTSGERAANSGSESVTVFVCACPSLSIA
jgi:7,8-dihydroneopterin aldolase/epimerase/oxygenase